MFCYEIKIKLILYKKRERWLPTFLFWIVSMCRILFINDDSVFEEYLVSFTDDE